MKIYTLEEVKTELMSKTERKKYEKELEEQMTLRKGDKVILHNRGIKEIGQVQRRWMRKEVYYFNVMTERGILLEGLTLDSNSPCHILEELSLKLGNYTHLHPTGKDHRFA